MAEPASAGQDVVMPSRPFRSSPDRALATSAHQLQRAGGTLQSHAGSPDAVPTHAITLAHVEEALDRMAVAMEQMANAVADWSGQPSAGLEEATLPPEARAVRWHLKSTAQRLRDSEEACAISREWTRRLLTAVPSGSHPPRQVVRDRAADDAKWS
jgi:hypothetical protein